MFWPANWIEALEWSSRSVLYLKIFKKEAWIEVWIAKALKAAKEDYKSCEIPARIGSLFTPSPLMVNARTSISYRVYASKFSRTADKLELDTVTILVSDSSSGVSSAVAIALYSTL